HVVGLPHRAHRALDEPAHATAAMRPAGGEVPEPGAQVRAAEDRVGGQADHRQRQAGLGHQPASTGTPTSTSGGRLARRRSSQTTVAASMTYTASATKNAIGRPLASVTASSTRI